MFFLLCIYLFLSSKRYYASKDFTINVLSRNINILTKTFGITLIKKFKPFLYLIVQDSQFSSQFFKEYKRQHHII